MSQHSDQVVNDLPARYFLVLGAAAADLWGELPQDLQHRLFERAVVLGHQGEQDESLREQLAKFLHDHHERTMARWPQGPSRKVRRARSSRKVLARGTAAMRQLVETTATVP